MQGVVSDLAPLGEDLLHRLRSARGLLADLEEGGVGVELPQDPQDPERVAARPVVEADRDPLPPARAVRVEGGPTVGAADRELYLGLLGAGRHGD
jgi:hypothetical protein